MGETRSSPRNLPPGLTMDNQEIEEHPQGWSTAERRVGLPLRRGPNGASTGGAPWARPPGELAP